MMQQSEIIIIDSFKRENGTSSDFKFKLNKPLRNVNKVELLHASLSNTIYTFNTNMKLQITQSDLIQLIIIFPNVSFSVDELVTYLQTQLNTLSSNYTVSYNESTFKITISNISSFTIHWSYPNSVYKMLGFTNVDTQGFIHTSSGSVSLEASDYILISIDKLSTVCSSKLAVGCFFVPISVKRGEVQQYNVNANFPQVISCNSLDFSDGHLLVISDVGNIVISDELNLKLVLKCYYC